MRRVHGHPRPRDPAPMPLHDAGLLFRLGLAVAALAPVEDPAVYQKVWDGFVQHMAEVTGLQLNASIMNLAWTEVSMILIVIIAMVIVSEWVSAKIRYAII